MINYITILFQIQPVAVDKETISLFDLLLKGGYIMLPIAILSIISISIFIERYLYIKQRSKIEPDFLLTIEDKLKAGNVESAIQYISMRNVPISKMLLRGIHRLGSPMRDIESAIEHTANIEISKMEKNLGYLVSIATIAPMLGFLGTVVGMIKAFYNISVSNNISIGVIAGGIYEKMVTSASGLIVGIVAYTFYTILNNKIDRSIGYMESVTSDFLDILYKKPKL